MPTLILRPARRGARLHQLDWGAALAARWRAWRFHLLLHQQRARLRDLADDPHMLRDLGLTRQQALDEADKPFWR
jgi:uncharacterized protein YjiS (DUF1127 family)